MTFRVTPPRPIAVFPARSSLTAYSRSESGSFTIFTLFILVMMIMIGGLAIDIMRFENVRATMQNTIDRAVLAAADLDQTVDAKTVVDDYLVKAGMGSLPYTVNVVERKIGDVVVGRQVSVDSEVLMRTYFMKMMGTPTLSVPATTTATEAVNNIEVSLVLDVSGSMGSNNKLANMQDAAKEFVDNVMSGAEEGSVSVSLVPYSTQVNAGAALAGQFNLSSEHTVSNCVDFSTSDFGTTELSTSTPLVRTSHFDPWTSYTRDAPQNWVCRTEEFVEILPWSIDAAGLKNQIEDLTAGGNTSIDVAAKWGTALLDPSTAPALDGLIATGDVDSGVAGRPAAHDNTDVLKFMVLMTDGINTTQYQVNPAYRSGPSGIWRDPNTGRFSKADVEIGNRDGDSRTNEPWYIVGGYNKSYGKNWDLQPYDRKPGGQNAYGTTEQNIYQMDWTEVWARMPVNTWSYSTMYQRYNNSSHYYNAIDAARSAVSDTQKDARLDSICTAAKDAGIVIFAIGFEVTDDSAAVMQSCASTANHFYRVDGLDISYAFESIANQINQLKLTQ